MTTRDQTVAHVPVASDVDARRTLLDESTFLALYARTAAPLHAYVSKTIGDASKADDLVQETFLRLLRRPVPTTDLEQLRRYTFRIAGNLIVDHWRATRRTSEQEAPDTAMSPPDHGRRIDIASLFRRLTVRDRTLMWLAHVEEVDHREIAAMLGVRRTSVRVLLSRARRRLAQLLREAGLGPMER